MAEGLELLLGAELVAVPALLLAAVHSPGLPAHLGGNLFGGISNPESVLLLQVTCTTGFCRIWEQWRGAEVGTWRRA